MEPIRPPQDAETPEQESERIQASMAACLAETKGLKPLSVAVQKALAMLRSSEYAVGEVARSFAGDPALASSVLRMANSALFRASAPIDSVEQAIVRLGSATLEELLVTAATSGLFNDATGAGAFYRDHCAGTAAVARWIANRLAPAHLDGLFLCGLMHDVGKLILLQGGQTFYKKTLDATDMREPDRIHLEERRVLGYDHAALGAHVLERWKIPAPLPAIVALHHQPVEAWRSERAAPRVALLRIADFVEPALAHGLPDAFDTLVQDLAERPEPAAADIDPAALAELGEELRQTRAETLSLITGLGR